MSLVAATSRCPGPCVISFFRIKASDEEACLVIIRVSTAGHCEIRVTKETGKLNMPQRRVNIPSLYRCNLV